jgi:hypothetical protein
MRKILFVCKKRTDTYGNSIGLVNSATFVSNFLVHLGHESKVVTVIDANGIDKEVHDYAATDVIIEALWVTPEKMQELLEISRYKNVNWLIRLHSKVPFLATEGIAFKWLAGYNAIAQTYENLIVSANSREITYDLYELLNIKRTYLPNIYYPQEYDIKVRGHEGDHINVGCFGAIRPLKNQLIQAIAALEFGDRRGVKIQFHLNADRKEQRGENVYKNIAALFEAVKPLGHTLVSHNWMTHENFIKTVVTMDIGLQASLSETFNIVAADFLWNGVPVIGSFDIDWMPEILQVNPNSSLAIASRMDRILRGQGKKTYTAIGKESLDRHNAIAMQLWAKAFD